MEVGVLIRHCEESRQMRDDEAIQPERSLRGSKRTGGNPKEIASLSLAMTDCFARQRRARNDRLIPPPKAGFRMTQRKNEI